MKSNNQTIGINIWDDYFEDGYVPEGEIQKTYAYVEADLPDEACRAILSNLMLEIARLVNKDNSLKCELEFYDSAKVHPSLVGTEHQWCLYKRWQLKLDNLPHVMREKLVMDLEAWSYLHDSRPVCVYSES